MQDSLYKEWSFERKKTPAASHKYKIYENEINDKIIKNNQGIVIFPCQLSIDKKYIFNKITKIKRIYAVVL